MIEQSDNTKTRRRWFQFRLRTLLAVALLMTLPFWWVHTKLDAKWREEAAVAWVIDNGGSVTYWPARGLLVADVENGHRPSWCDTWFGHAVSQVNLARLSFKDFSHLKEFPNLVALFINLTDTRDLSPLAELPQLESLFVEGYVTSDWRSVGRIDSLVSLIIYSEHVGDLTPLASLPNLQFLSINTHYGQNNVDLSPIAEIKTLKMLTVSGIDYDVKQLDMLRNALPNLEVHQL